MKYRIWDKKRCKWINDEAVIASDGEVYSKDPDGDHYWDYQSIADVVVNLYTEYKDNKKNEIYQNDIIEINDELYLVIWHEGAFGIIPEDALLEEVSYYAPRPMRDVVNAIVKGNMYEHKFLLRRFQ